MNAAIKIISVIQAFVIFVLILTLNAAMKHGAAQDILLKQAKEREAICAETLRQKPPLCTKKHRACLVMRGDVP